jgi:hypothetical protein
MIAGLSSLLAAFPVRPWPRHLRVAAMLRRKRRRVKA